MTQDLDTLALEHLRAMRGTRAEHRERLGRIEPRLDRADHDA